MYRFSTACLAGLVVFLCLGVTVSADAQTCACASEFAFVRAHLEANYAGYDDKVTATTKPAYLKQVAELEAKAKG
jgi:uncharacterized protein YqkB